MALTLTLRPGESVQIGGDTLTIVKRGNNSLTAEFNGQTVKITASDWLELNPRASVRVGIATGTPRPPRLMVKTDNLNVTLPKKASNPPVSG